MTTPAWPNLDGLAPEVERIAIWPTIIQTSSTGKETINWTQSQPRFRYSLTYKFMRTSAGEIATFLATLALAHGRAGIFTFTDPVDGVTRNVRMDSDEATCTQIVPGVISATVTLISVL